MVTVKELKQFLKDIPDDTEIRVFTPDGDAPFRPVEMVDSRGKYFALKYFALTEIVEPQGIPVNSNKRLGS